MPLSPTIHELFDLTGRVAIVTGASGWLGAAMSHALAEAGATLAVTSRDAAKAEEFAATLPGSGHRGFAFAQDDTDAIPAFVDDVVAQLGQVDILINNAYGGTAADIDDATAEEFDSAYHTGVTSYFILARAVVHHLRERRAASAQNTSVHGSIINIGSMYGVVASYPDAYEDLPVNSPPIYHGLKGGVVHLTRHLAVYWAKDNVRVNAISPGAFPSQTVKETMPDFIQRLETKVPVGRMGLPHELKGIAVLLASDAGSYLTGQNILVDGGWTAW